MVKSLKLLLLAMAMIAGGSANAQYQLANGTFDGDFVKCYPWEKGAKVTTDYGTQPDGWCISNVPNSMAKPMAAQVEGKNGKAVKITNTSAMGNGIPAYLTLGTTWATAETRMTSTRNKDGGLFGGIAFTKHPDALKFVYKRDGKDKNDESVVLVYSWKGTWTQASVPSNTAVGIISWGAATKVDMTDRDNNILGRDVLLGGAVTKTADAELIAVGETKITGSQADWTEVIVPIEYKSDNAPEKINVVFSAAGYQSDASITDGVNITIDDVEFVYNSGLVAKYAGEDIIFDENNSAIVDADYDENNISLKADGQAATIASSVYDAKTNTLTVKVEGENISEDADNYHVYTIQFAKASSDPQVVGSKTYTERFFVTTGGQTTDLETASVVVETLDNGNINFILKNFVLGTMPIGNLSLKDVEVAADNTFAYQGGINIEPGDDENYNGQWLGPKLAMFGEIPMNLSGKFVGEDILATIDIDMPMGMGTVNVHFGYEYATLNVTAAGYATFCAPFEVKAPEGIKAYTCSSVNEDSELVLEEIVLTENIPANTPVILEGSVGSGEYFGVAEPSNGLVCGLLTGVYEETPAPVGSYVLQQKEDKVAFFKVASSDVMVGANRAYLSMPSSNAKAFTFNPGSATSIKALNSLMNGKAEIYDLNGRKRSSLQKGINIVNGTKVVVK